MANSDKPFGLRPYRHITGSPWNGRISVYYHSASDSTAIFKGDVVQTDPTNTETTGKYPSVIQHAATQVDNVGVVVGFGNTPQLATDVTDLTRKYCPAATAMYLAVVDDPWVIFVAQEDDNMGVAAVHACCDIVVGSGDTTTGLSTMEIDSSEATTSGTLRVLRLADWDDASGSNALGTNAKWEVMITEHHFKYEAGT
jgi:hypothetical protein